MLGWAFRSGAIFRAVKSRVPWHLLQDRQPRAHLVVGAIVQANGPAGLNDSTAALVVLRRLARKQRPAGDYAATVVGDAGWPEVYFAFTDEADAKKFAEAVQAEPIGTYPGMGQPASIRNRRRKAQGARGFASTAHAAKTTAFV
jgi:hypothetical protein